LISHRYADSSLTINEYVEQVYRLVQLTFHLVHLKTTTMKK